MRRFRDGRGREARVYSLASGFRLRVRREGAIAWDRTYPTERDALVALRRAFPGMAEERG